MRIALTVWNGRIAPVFDVAGTARLVEHDGAGITEDQTVALPQGSGMISRIDTLIGLGIDVLVCGAISRPVHRMIAASGIRIHSFVSGEADKVLEALLSGKLEEKPFSMPGCGMGRNGHGCGRGAGNRSQGRGRGFLSGKKEV